MFRRLAALVLPALTQLGGCDAASDTNPKLDEIARLPIGMEVKCTPNPVIAELGGRSGRKYTWLYTTSVKSTTGPLTLVEFESFTWAQGKWILSTFTGKPFTPNDFADWYSCPQANLSESAIYSDPTNWSGGGTLQPCKMKWCYIATNAKGEHVKGEAEIELRAALKD